MTLYWQHFDYNMEAVHVDESWLVVFYISKIKVVAGGFMGTAGLIGLYLIEGRGFNREELSWVTTIFSVVMPLCCTFAAAFCRLYGPKTSVCLGAVILSGMNVISALSSEEKVSIYLTYASTSAVGVALLWNVATIIANTYFCEKMQRANGILMFTTRASTVVFLPLTSWTLGQYGLQGTFFVWAGISLNCVMVGMLIPTLIPEVSAQQDNTRQKRDYEKIKTCFIQGNSQTLERKHSEETKNKMTGLKGQNQVEPNAMQKSQSPKPPTARNPELREKHCLNQLIFHLFHTFIAVDLFRNWRSILSLFSCRMLINVPVNYAIHGHLPDFIVQAGHPMDLTWQPLVTVGIGNAFGSLLISTGERSLTLVSKVFCLAVLVMSAGFLVLPFTVEYYWFLCVWGGTFGLAEGLFLSLRGLILAEIVPIEDFDRAYGTGYIGDALFYVLVCPLFGILFDRTGTYRWTFLICGCLQLLACFGNIVILYRDF